MSELPDWKTIPRAELAKLVAEDCDAGLTARQIAEKYQNCSRSAVIGLVHRLKLKFNNGVPRKGKTGRGTKTSGEPAPKSPSKPRATKLVKETTSWRGANNPHRHDIKGRIEQRAASPGLAAHLVAGEARRANADVVPASRRLKLIELSEKTCKWPNGDPQSESFSFCGNDSTGAGSYCRYHARLAYTPPSFRLSVPRGA